MEGFSIGRLPIGARSLLRDMPDEHSTRLWHEASMAEMRDFWRGLDADQVMFIAKMLRRVMDADEPATKAASYFGNAEAILHMIHGGCVCGERHRDPDDLLKELVMRGTEYEAETEALELYGLRRVQAHGLDGSQTLVLVCTGCGHAYDSVEQRRAAGDPGKCPGCMNNDE